MTSQTRPPHNVLIWKIQYFFPLDNFLRNLNLIISPQKLQIILFSKMAFKRILTEEDIDLNLTKQCGLAAQRSQSLLQYSGHFRVQ